MQEKQIQLLRILLIGLPYSGVHSVANILQKEYHCKIKEIKSHQQPQGTSLKKYAREICYQDLRDTPRAVIITTEFNSDILSQLKKRNYLNIVLVDSTFQSRYSKYLTQLQLIDKHENVIQFMKSQSMIHNQEYQNCLEYAKVRVINNGSIEKLRESILKKKEQILRPYRPTWDQYFMKMADIARRRSNCMKTSVGAVIVNDNNRVVSTGYNGTPKGLISCYKFGCVRCNQNEGKKLDQCLCLHAQESAIIQVGIGKTFGCRLYTTYYPCFSCAKLIQQAGINKIYYMDEYEKQDSGKPFIQNYFSPENVVKIKSDDLYY